MQYPALTKSIVLNVAVSCVLNALVFLAIQLVHGIPWSAWVFYGGVSIGLHLVLMVGLFYWRPEFFIVDSGERIEYINFATQLTMFRITSTASILVLIKLAQNGYAVVPWLIAYTLLAFISDFLDGKISRSRGQVTKVGTYLDSSSDYLVLILIGVSFTLYRLVDPWFFGAAMIRFCAQWFFMGFLFFARKGKVEPVTTFLGKASVFAAMTVFAVSLMQIIPPFTNHYVVFRDFLFWFEVVVSALLTASLVEKVVMFIKELKADPPRNQDAGSAPS